MSEDPKAAAIHRQHALLEKRNYFELLGVEPDTPDEVVRSQREHLTRQWHPDAFSHDLNPDLRRKVEEIFQTINEAFDTLSDPAKKTEYLTLVERRKAGMATDVHAVLQAEGLVDEALLAMRQKRWKDAESKLEEARSLNPDDPLFAVHQAWAHYHANPKKNRDAALKMLKDSVKKQESLAEGYQYLGQIHFLSGEYDPAMRWWKKCLEWDPKNMEATRGLRLAHARKQKEKSSLPGWLNKLLGK